MSQPSYPKQPIAVSYSNTSSAVENGPPAYPGTYQPTSPVAYPPIYPSAYPPTSPGVYPPPSQGAYPRTPQGAYPPPSPGAYPPTSPGPYPPTSPGAYPPTSLGAYLPTSPSAIQQQFGVVVQQAQRPPDYLVYSIVNLICCCCVFGVIALMKSLASRSAYDRGDIQGAVSASRSAKNWNIVALVVGMVIFGTGLAVVFFTGLGKGNIFGNFGNSGISRNSGGSRSSGSFGNYKQPSGNP